MPKKIACWQCAPSKREYATAIGAWFTLDVFCHYWSERSHRVGGLLGSGFTLHIKKPGQSRAKYIFAGAKRLGRLGQSDGLAAGGNLTDNQDGWAFQLEIVGVQLHLRKAAAAFTLSGQ